MNFETTNISVRGLNTVGVHGWKTIPGVKYQDWAAHRSVDCPDLYFITLLPLGLCLPPDFASFHNLEQAITAMVDIAKLRNDWHIADQDVFTIQLRNRIKHICERHGSVKDAPVAIQVEADKTLTGRPMSVRPN